MADTSIGQVHYKDRSTSVDTCTQLYVYHRHHSFGEGHHLEIGYTRVQMIEHDHHITFFCQLGRDSQTPETVQKKKKTAEVVMEIRTYLV